MADEGDTEPRADRLPDVRTPLAELAPMLRRAIRLDPSAAVRIRVADGSAAALVRLPFGVLVARTVDTDVGADVDVDFDPIDVVVRASETLDWLDEVGTDLPLRRDADWRGGSPPKSGWTRVETVPDTVIRGLVRGGATTLAELAAREGVPGAQPRAEVSDALLDSVVLTVTDGGTKAEITLRVLSALTRMAFLPRDSHAAVDIAGRWVRVAAAYGSVFLERPGGLSVLS